MDEQDVAVPMNTGEVSDIDFAGEGTNGEYLDSQGEIIYDDPAKPDRVPFVPGVAIESNSNDVVTAATLREKGVTLSSDDPGISTVVVAIGPFPNGAVAKVNCHVAVGNSAPGKVGVKVTTRPETPATP